MTPAFSSINVRRSRALCALSCFGMLAVSAPLYAQPSATDRNLAQSLFEQGKALMAEEHYAEACPKLAESQRLDPGGGTLLNLALCHEKLGKVATAWTDFKAALSVARQEGRSDRIQAAEEHIRTLEPLLPWLTINVVQPASGLELLLDGAVFGSAAWGTPVAVDPGTHELVASAPGRTSWSLQITVAPSDRQAVTVPELSVTVVAAPEPAPAPTTGAAAPTNVPVSVLPEQDQAPPEALGGATPWLIGGAGLASLGVGTFFGLRAFSLKGKSDELCPSDTTCSDEGVRYNQDANRAAWISNVGIGLGLIGVGVSAYMLLTDDGGSAAARRASPIFIDGVALPDGGYAAVGSVW